jgi:hypothetical protein
VIPALTGQHLTAHKSWSPVIPALTGQYLTAHSFAYFDYEVRRVNRDFIIHCWAIKCLYIRTLLASYLYWLMAVRFIIIICVGNINERKFTLPSPTFYEGNAFCRSVHISLNGNQFLIVWRQQLRYRFFPSGFPINILYAFLVSPIRPTYPAHFILRMFGEEYKLWSSSLCSVPQSPVTSSLFGPNTFSQTPSVSVPPICPVLGHEHWERWYHTSVILILCMTSYH